MNVPDSLDVPLLLFDTDAVIVARHNADLNLSGTDSECVIRL